MSSGRSGRRRKRSSGRSGSRRWSIGSMRSSERGLREGLDSGEGADGPQFVLGGMRSGPGVQRRRRLPAAGSVAGAFELSGHGARHRQPGLHARLRSRFPEPAQRADFVNWYTKFESSPRMDYYGQGNSSNESDRTSYLLRRLDDGRACRLRAGALPAARAHRRFHRLPRRLRSAGRRAVDRRALRPGDGARLGGRSGVRAMGGLRRSSITAMRGADLAAAACTARASGNTPDLDLDRYSFRQAEFEAQQYLPYFNRTRVIALRAATVLSFPTEGQRGAFLSAADDRRQRRSARLRALPVLRRSRRLFQRRAPLARFHRARHGRVCSTPARSIDRKADVNFVALQGERRHRLPHSCRSTRWSPGSTSRPVAKGSARCGPSATSYKVRW